VSTALALVRSATIARTSKPITTKDMLAILQQRHEEKMQRSAATSKQKDDSFDYCLILQPQYVYGFWAELLDFRAHTDDQGCDNNNEIGMQSTTIVEHPTPSCRQRRTPKWKDATPSINTFLSSTPSMMSSYNNNKNNNNSMLLMSSTRSIFERAMGTPPASATSTLANSKSFHFDTVSLTTPATTVRRKWGSQIPMPATEPHRLLLTPMHNQHHQRQLTPMPHQQRQPSPPTAVPTNTSPKSNPNELQLQDIPQQRFARGIAARTNGMLPFLAALKRGIVVRMHRPQQEAIYVRLESSNGGDTIRLVQVDQETAMQAFQEQRIQYVQNNTNTNTKNAHIQPWSCYDSDSNSRADIPDHVAAQQYRHYQQRALLSRTTCATIQAADLAVVHPATFQDPRSQHNETGTSTLRRSKSDYSRPHCFSLVLRKHMDRHRRLYDTSGGAAAAALDEYESKWLAGQGTDAQYKYYDLEAASIPEYWLIFRGFLLLHRDAAVGRFASKRAAGIGSHYSRMEVEQRKENLLQADAYREPKTVGCFERLVRRRDPTLEIVTRGEVLDPNAVPPPSDYFLGFRSPGTEIWSRLRQAGLETSCVYALDTDRVMIKVRCPPERMMDVAEVLRIKMKCRDGMFAPFHEEMMDLYSRDNNEELFRSSLRCTIINFIVGSRIRDSGAELSQQTELGKMIQARVPLHERAQLDAIYSAWFYFWRAEHWQGGRDGRSMAADKCFDKDKTEQPAPNLFKRVFVGCMYQPLDSIEQYFGEKVAFYFAWLQHTANHLAVLSVFGLILFICQISSGNWDHPLRPAFSMVVMLWTFYVLVNWKKRANFLAHRWGTINYKEQETTRPQFHGDFVRDEVTREWVVKYPKWKRYLKYLISFPLTLFFTGGALTLILWVHANRDIQLAEYQLQKKAQANNFHLDFGMSAFVKHKTVVDVRMTSQNLRDPAFWFIVVGMPSLLGLCLPLLNQILLNISVMLNDFENYRTESEYRTFLIIKVFSFRFVCYFATLYYYAFVSVGSDLAIANGILRVASGVLIYTTVAQWWQNFLFVCFPIMTKELRMRHRRRRLVSELSELEIDEDEAERLAGFPASKNDEALKQHQIDLVNKRILLDQAQDELWLEVMNPQHDSFPEYISAVVLFTYVSCFSVVLPITPILCLFNYLVSMRLDAYKLCKGRRRPLAEKTGGIGIWEHLLHIVAVISVLTNCWLIGFTSEMFTNIGDAIGQIGLFALVVGWEHFMLLIKYVMQTSISPLPKEVRDAMKQEQFELDQQRSLTMRARRLQHHREAEEREMSLTPHSAVRGDIVNFRLDAKSCWRKPNPQTVETPLNLRGLQTIPSEDQDSLANDGSAGVLTPQSLNVSTVSSSIKYE
jgi:hypothetical protein